MEKHLHIISLTVPYPVDYGGVVDLFYKLPALHKQGVSIHLHCFRNNRPEQEKLNDYCVSVNYYDRQIGHKGFMPGLPYMVSSRKNEELLDNLLKDDYPILMEGVQCTWLLNDKRFANRNTYVRIHNVEQDYYYQLFESANSLLHKIYYRWESYQLKKYEQSIVSKATAFWGVTEKDVAVYRNRLGCKTIDYLPVYLPENQDIKCREGKGNYCLYHGDLSVDTNEKAVIWLLENVFNIIQVPFVIAGKNPSARLEKMAHAQDYTCLVANPGEREMQDMVSKAHIHILPSFSKTGIKLKLLNALFNGRYVIVNKHTVDGSGLEELCTVAGNASEFREHIKNLFDTPFHEKQSLHRKNLLGTIFSNERNAIQQVQWIWGV